MQPKTVPFGKNLTMFLLQYMPKEDLTAEATIVCFSASGIASIVIALVKSKQLEIKPRVDILIK